MNLLLENETIKTKNYFCAEINLKQIILRKLFRRRINGAKHTAFEHVASGVPKHLHDEAKKCAEELIKQGFILTKPTSYGLQISLNHERIEEIINIIEGNSES